MSVVELQPAALREPGRVLRAAGEGLVAVVHGFWSAERAADAADRVLAARDRWVRDFDGEQFCLGRAWYTHLETDRSGEYFRNAAASDANVEAVLPGLQAELREVLAAVVGAPVDQRRGWCGAGVHVFPAGELCARRGGEIHFDHEGLTRAQLRAGAPALSLVHVLQAAEQGGGLRVWDARYAGSCEASLADRARPSVFVDYGPGDLVVFDSHHLHQIQPFGGQRARISATLHGAAVGDRWECWF